MMMNPAVALNQLLAYLAHSETTTLATFQPDLVILAGNSLPSLTLLAGEVAQKQHCPLLLVGGHGHATQHLVDQLQHADLLPLAQSTRGVSEAGLNGMVLARQGLQQPIYYERLSRNTGENARFAWQVVQRYQLSAKRVALLQDPFLQRRTWLTFVENWPLTTQFYSVNPELPQFRTLTPALKTVPASAAQWWSQPYLLALAVGEIQRLQDTPQGYGPNGAGFIPHVKVPVPVLQAAAALQQHYQLAAQIQR
ncbi:ElyC/SanA/YdcF family protein [Loigolactobacillus bifermentans]|nr:ElyC/SanA/YdcF family protein [Loigolactobacillus bifermentans]QGG60908.1 YdcF family protein [Loigolactobacillus bifermentans]